MQIVTISQLKNRLSHYLRVVAKGEPVFVRSRDRVVARLEAVRDGGVRASEDETWLRDLELRGTLRPAQQAITNDWLKGRPRLGANLLQAVLDERAGGR